MRAGKVSFVERGFRDEHKAELEQRIAALLSAERTDADRLPHRGFLLLLLASLAASPAARRWTRPSRGSAAISRKPGMQFDSDRLDAKTQQHIYTSKEAATGGYGVGGGGCGCN